MQFHRRATNSSCEQHHSLRNVAFPGLMFCYFVLKHRCAYSSLSLTVGYVGVPPLAFYFTTGLHFGSKSPIGDLVWLDGLSVIWIFFFFLNSGSRTNISHNTKMNESELNAPRTFVMWTLVFSTYFFDLLVCSYLLLHA